MMSIPVQSSTKSILAFPSFTSQNPNFTPFKTSFSLKPVASSPQLSTHIGLKTRPVRRIQRINVAADSELGGAELNDTADSELAPEETPLELTDTEILDSEERRVQYVPIHKHRLVLKFIWMEKNMALGLDQMIPGYGPVPLSPYYFWPRKDAWEELKTAIESKPWISQKKMIILLNQATDIINLWQQSGGNLS